MTSVVVCVKVSRRRVMLQRGRVKVVVCPVGLDGASHLCREACANDERGQQGHEQHEAPLDGRGVLGKETAELDRGQAGGEEQGKDARADEGALLLVDRQIADETARLAVHGKEELPPSHVVPSIQTGSSA